MTKVLDDDLLDRAAREAARALAERDPETLAGRFAPSRSVNATAAAEKELPIRKQAAQA